MALSVLAVFAVTGPTPPKWTHTAHLKHGGLRRTYHALSPAGKGPHPILLMLHGSGGDAASFAMQTPLLTAGAVERGYFAVFPEGVEAPGSKLRCRERTWNSGQCCGEAFLTKADDVGFLVRVVEDVRRTFPSASASDAFVAGSSNGGSMALRLACERPGLVKAAVPQISSYEGVAGAACAGEC